MHDTESDTFVLKTESQKYCDLLAKIGIEAQPKDIGTDEIEKGDYFSRYFSQATRMITNRGCLEPRKSNIDIIQIIQKG
jgi:hypothetical protein